MELRECIECYHTVKHLFAEGGIFLPDAHGTMTSSALRAIQDKEVFLRSADGRGEIILMGWPDPASREAAAPQAHAKRFFDLYVAFMESHFPQWETGHLFGVFDLRASLTISERAHLLKQLCHRYDKPFEVVKRALFANGDAVPGAGSVFQRAVYHLAESPRSALNKSVKEPRFPGKPKIDSESGLITLAAKCHLREPASANARAWLQTLKDMRKLVSKPRYLPLIELIECFVSRLSSTATIERWFKQIALTELKQRADKLGVPVLEAALKLRVQDLGGVHASAQFDPRKLLIRRAPAVTATGQAVAWPATEHSVCCQKIYAEWFGTRRSECRSMRMHSLDEKTMHSLPRSKLRLGPELADNTIKARKRKHMEAIAAAVAASEAKLRSEAMSGVALSTPGSSSDAVAAASTIEPSTSKKHPSDPVEVQKIVAARKKEASASATPGKPVEYVGSRGESFRANKPLKKGKYSDPLPLAVVQALPIKVFCGEGIRTAKLHDTFKLVKEVGLADVIVVHNYQGQCAHSLAARLLGTRLANEDWLISKMKSGKCLQFHAHVLRSSFTFYMTDAFVTENAEHVKMLKLSAKINKKLRTSKKTKSKQRT